MLLKTRPSLYMSTRARAPNERLLTWQKAAGVWKGRGSKMLRELRRLRREWDKRVT